MKKVYLIETAKKWGILTLLSLVLAACAQTKRDRLQGSPAGSGPSGVVASSSATCTPGVVKVGMIYDNGQLSTPFQQGVRNFISSWMNPNLLGNIDGSSTSTTTGIDFQGAFVFNTAGQLIQSNSGFRMAIYDSNVGQPDGQGGQYGPITVDFNASKYASATCRGTLTGTVNKSTQQFTVTASDCAGNITFTGQYAAGGYVTGTVGFYNSRTVSNYFLGQGTLGGLRIATCGLMQIQ